MVVVVVVAIVAARITSIATVVVVVAPATLDRLVGTVAAVVVVVVVATLISIAIAGTTTLGRTIVALGRGIIVELHDAQLALPSATLASIELDHAEVRDRVCLFADSAKYRVGHGSGRIHHVLGDWEERRGEEGNGGGGGTGSGWRNGRATMFR